MIPDFQSFFYPILKYSSDGKEHSLEEVRDFLTKHFSLSDKDKAERVPSGVQTKFDNRIYWTKSYFFKAKLIENTKRSHFKITERGLKFLQNFTSEITIADLKTIDEFKKFSKGEDSSREEIPSTKNDDNNQFTEETKTPLEKLEESYQYITQELALELLEKIRSNSWQFFEDLVIDLMVKMGYGGSRNIAGESINRTKDEGIDGIIKEDKLGLDKIYIQAKKWENSVGRPEIQKFVGALQGKRAKKGVFITTSDFSRDAHDYVKNLDVAVILIDGEKLSQYMIENELGVSMKQNFKIYSIDNDYFEK
jgi:restriction system protein